MPCTSTVALRKKSAVQLGGKVLVLAGRFIRTLAAARLAGDVMEVPKVLVARTDAQSAGLLTFDIDPCDEPFLAETEERFFSVKGGPETALARGLTQARYADMLRCETSTPDLEDARRYEESVQGLFRECVRPITARLLLDGKKHLANATIAASTRAFGYPL
jgi:isocitrate lyase